MSNNSFTKAELERVMDASRDAHKQIIELHIIKTDQGTTLRAIFDLPPQVDVELARFGTTLLPRTLPEPWS